MISSRQLPDWGLFPLRQQYEQFWKQYHVAIESAGFWTFSGFEHIQAQMFHSHYLDGLGLFFRGWLEESLSSPCFHFQSNWEKYIFGPCKNKQKGCIIVKFCYYIRLKTSQDLSIITF